MEWDFQWMSLITWIVHLAILIGANGSLQFHRNDSCLWTSNVLESVHTTLTKLSGYSAVKMVIIID